MPWTFYVILFIVGTFVAVLITRVVCGPIKQRRAKKQWNAWKDQNEVLKPGYW